MKIKTIIILMLSLLIYNHNLKSQTNKNFIKVDRVMLRIPDSMTYSSQNIANYINIKFHSQNDKARAIYCWITESIQYDFDNMYAIDMYNSDISSDETLKSRKGICTNYANLYSDIANKVGVKTYVITGYTRKKKHVNQNPHAWCVSMIDTSWYMIDPTWGSGYIQNSNYIKKINNNFFKIQPNSFIKSHIPFDPLWQFLNYPITKQEFHHGTSKSKNENLYFNFIDTLKIYESQSSFNRLLSSSIRIESNGICCYLDYDNLSDIKFNIKVHYKKVDKELFNSAANQYKKGIFMLNEYIGYANKYYVPYKSDSEIRQMLEDIRITFNLALQQLEKSKYLTSSLENEIHQLKKSINQALVELKKQKNSLDKYLEIAKKYRETLSNSNEK